MVKIQVDYTGSLRCQATHEPSGKPLETDAPKDNQGEGASFSPTDLCATALATCMATTMAIVAKRHGIELGRFQVEITKEMTSEPPRRIARLATELTMPVPRSHPQAEMLEKTAQTCPVWLSLNPEIEKPIRFHYPAENQR